MFHVEQNNINFYFYFFISLQGELEMGEFKGLVGDCCGSMSI